jgi:hypothetical protein
VAYSFRIDSVTSGKACVEINRRRKKSLFMGHLKKVGVFKIYINNMMYVEIKANRRDSEKKEVFLVDLHFSKKKRDLGINIYIKIKATNKEMTNPPYLNKTKPSICRDDLIINLSTSENKENAEKKQKTEPEKYRGFLFFLHFSRNWNAFGMIIHRLIATIPMTAITPINAMKKKV